MRRLSPSAVQCSKQGKTQRLISATIMEDRSDPGLEEGRSRTGARVDKGAFSRVGNQYASRPSSRASLSSTFPDSKSGTLTTTVLYAEIESEEALKVYADHDAHVHFKTLTGYKTGSFQRRAFFFLCVRAGADAHGCSAQISWLLTSRCRETARPIGNSRRRYAAINGYSRCFLSPSLEGVTAERDSGKGAGRLCTRVLDSAEGARVCKMRGR